MKENEYIKQQENQKIDKIYNELVTEMKINIDKDELKKVIKEENFNKDKVKSWMETKNAENIYNILLNDNDCDFQGQNKDQILNKIKSLDFDEEKIKNEFKKNERNDIHNDEANNNNNNNNNNIEDNKGAAGGAAGEEDEKADQMYQELDEEYGISGFKDEDEVKDKIREYNFNRDEIVKWIEESLLNN